MIEVARELYEHCLYMAHSVLNYPLLKGELLKIESVQEQQDSEAGDV